VRKNAKFTSHSTPGWNWDYQQFNMTMREDLPYHNKLVRQAISYAIDREAIVNEIYYGEALATDNQIPAGYLGHRKPMMKYPKNGDLKKAKELMAQAGVKGYEVEVITSDKDWLRKELELVAAMVSQIGITYKIKNMDMGGFNNLWLNQRFEQNLEDITLVAPDPDATSWWFMHSKGMASGYPVTAVISTQEISHAEPWAKPSGASSSYGGNPLAATAALATLETVLDEKLVERSAALGEEMKQRLRAMQEKYEFLGDVRGVGLLVGLDLVKDRKTKEPLARPVTERIFLECLRRGLLLMGYVPRVRINPPLTITREEMDQGLGILDEVFADVARDRSYR